MQTQQVNGVSGGLFYTAKTASAKSSGSSFEQLIQMSQNAGAAENNTQKPAETTRKDAAEDVKKTEKPADTAKEEKTEVKTKSEEKPEMKKTGSKDEASDVEAAEKAAGVLNEVTEKVKEVLDLTDEQLAMLMEQMGITQMDLLNPETLQNLVLMANNGQDAVMLLTDANLLAAVQEVTEQVQMIVQESGMTLEDLTAAMEHPEFEALVSEALEQLGEEEVQTETAVDTADTAAVEEKSTTIEFKTENNKGEEHAQSGDNREFSSENEQFANQFVQNLQNVAEQVTEVSGQKDMVQMIREIADQILEKVKVTVTPETTSLEIVLTPEELGRVNLKVTEQDGMMKAVFTAENELAKEAIESNLIQFKEMLNEQGLKVESIEVMVGGFTFDKNSEAGQNAQEEKKNGNRQFMTDEEITGPKEETDQLARHFMEGGESNVNYMA